MLRAFLFSTAVAAVLLTGQQAAAELKVVGKGKRQRLVRSQFTAEQRPRYDVFARKCTKCHAMARPITALRTGRTPVTDSRFDRAGIKRYVIKMMRKPNSGIGRHDAKAVLRFLVYARSLARQP